MRVIRLFFLLSLLFLIGCLERYYPDDDELKTHTLVVSAHLTDQGIEQNIVISRSDKLVHPNFLPEEACHVEVVDDAGNILVFEEGLPGIYSAIPDPSFLDHESLFRLNIITSEGEIYTSDYEPVEAARHIDSIYYELEKLTAADPLDTTYGIQFYVDYEIGPAETSYTRWELTETFEFKNPNHDGFIYDRDRILKPLPDELSDRHCWITLPVSSIFVQSTDNLSGTRYRALPLHYVSNETQRLQHRYSILVRQFSLSESAYRYWSDLKRNTSEQGTLFDQQPALIASNICNCENPEERIIGYFSISGISEKRIFVEDVEGLEIPDEIFCFPGFEVPKLRFIPPELLPAYLARGIWPEDGKVYFGEIAHECLDCRIRKGSQGEAPEYW